MRETWIDSLIIKIIPLVQPADTFGHPHPERFSDTFCLFDIKFAKAGDNPYVARTRARSGGTLFLLAVGANASVTIPRGNDFARSCCDCVIELGPAA